MLIVVSTLNFNGGSTFILRMAKEMLRCNDKLGVLVLTDSYDKVLLEKISRVADVFFLQRLVWFGTGSLMDVFLPYKKEISGILEPYGNHAHAMGVFSLFFLKIYIQRCGVNLNVSVGIYHQNEFMFRGGGSYFERQACKVFGSIPASNVILFNENCRDAYAQFFHKDYRDAPLLPVGIEVPSFDKEVAHDGFRIVSVGNLHPFKTYNKHVISLLPSLLKVNKEVRYEIYGEGECEGELRALAGKLRVEHAVEFKGRIAYEDMANALEGAFLFVGSGTAIVEASVLGIPSMIGIESVDRPVTYGFFSSIAGFSYQEKVEGKLELSIEGLIKDILVDERKWEHEALACREKAKLFSMKYTLVGFKAVERKGVLMSPCKHGNIHVVRLFLSFLWLGIKHKSGLDKRFADRRNQGSFV